MEQPKEYYAFISYKREDEKWANWLQNKLEHYRFPTNLNGRTDLPKNIRPTFRDVTDLKPGLLADEINNALHNSEWLIVICSPRSAKSPWVCKEAQTFIDLGRADHIIPFVIEGNPFSNDPVTECYPEALLNLTGSKELLAANINEMGRDAAAIKVVARMFGLKFDALWQRYEKEKKRRRWMIIGASLFFSFVSIAIGIYITWQNQRLEALNSAAVAERDRANTERDRANTERDRANKERDRAEQINAFLRVANDSILFQQLQIERTNSILKSTNRSLLENQCRAAAGRALQLLEDGDTYSALRLVLAVLPKDLSHQEIPYIPEAEAVLRKALQVDSTVFRTHENHDILYSPCFSPDGTKLAVISDDHTIPIWDCASGRLLKSLDGKSEKQFETISFMKDGAQLQAVSSDGFSYLWDIASGQLLSRATCKRPQTQSNLTAVSPDGQYSATARYDRDKDLNYVVVKATGFKARTPSLIIEGKTTDNQSAFSSDSRHILVAIEKDDEDNFWEGRTDFVIYDTSSGQPVRTIKSMDVAFVEEVSFSPDRKHVLLTGMSGNYQVFDKSISMPIWTAVNESSRSLCHSSFSADGRYIISRGDSLWVRRSENGRAVCILPLEEASPSAMVCPTGRRLAYAVGSELKVWNLSHNRLERTLYSDDGDISAIIFSNDGLELLAGTERGKLLVWNSHTWERTGRYEIHFSPNALSFDKKGVYLVASMKGGPIHIWSYPTMVMLDSFETGEITSIDPGVISPDGQSILTFGYYDCQLWKFPPLQELIDQTRMRFKNRPLTPEERKKYYLE